MPLSVNPVWLVFYVTNKQRLKTDDEDKHRYHKNVGLFCICCTIPAVDQRDTGGIVLLDFTVLMTFSYWLYFGNYMDTVELYAK